MNKQQIDDVTIEDIVYRRVQSRFNQVLDDEVEDLILNGSGETRQILGMINAGDEETE